MTYKLPEPHWSVKLLEEYEEERKGKTMNNYSVRIMFRPTHYQEPTLPGGEGTLFGTLFFWKGSHSGPIKMECQAQVSRSLTTFTPPVGQKNLPPLLTEREFYQQIEDLVRIYLDSREGNATCIWHHHKEPGRMDNTPAMKVNSQ